MSIHSNRNGTDTYYIPSLVNLWIINSATQTLGARLDVSLRFYILPTSPFGANLYCWSMFQRCHDTSPFVATRDLLVYKFKKSKIGCAQGALRAQISRIYNTNYSWELSVPIGMRKVAVICSYCDDKIEWTLMIRTQSNNGDFGVLLYVKILRQHHSSSWTYSDILPMVHVSP